MIDMLGKAKFITMLDLARGYWQVLIQEESRLLAFDTAFRLFQFRVMPFGLHSVLATFQRIMNQLLANYSDYAASLFGRCGSP